MTIKLGNVFMLKLGGKRSKFEIEYIETLIRIYKMNVASFTTEKAAETRKQYETEITRTKGKIIGACEILDLRAEFKETSSDVNVFQKSNLIIH